MFFVWIIYGPTSSGKTARALALAREKGANILSFDARQFYQDMAILTGQDIPDNYQQNSMGVWTTTSAHQPELYGLNIIKPNEPFSIRHYYSLAKKVINQHRQTNQSLVMVGGSWPYAQVVIDPPSSLTAPPNPELRSELQTLTVQQLQQKLQSLNPSRFQVMNQSDQHNPRRLIRAIEISTETTPVNAFHPLLAPTEYSLILHSLPIENIESNIRQRIQQRLNNNALAEVSNLLSEYPADLPAFSSTGFQYLANHLDKKISLQEVEQLWYWQERQYVKRQLTWLKKINNEKRYNIHQ